MKKSSPVNRANVNKNREINVKNEVKFEKEDLSLSPSLNVKYENEYKKEIESLRSQLMTVCIDNNKLRQREKEKDTIIKENLEAFQILMKDFQIMEEERDYQLQKNKDLFVEIVGLKKLIRETETKSNHSQTLYKGTMDILNDLLDNLTEFGNDHERIKEYILQCFKDNKLKF